MIAVVRALALGALSFLHPRMLLLTLAPLFAAAALWAGLVAWCWEPAVNAVQRALSGSARADWAANLAGDAGLGQWSFRFDAFTAPVIVALLIVPLVILTVVAIVGGIAGPIAVRHVARRDYPDVEARGRESLALSGLNALVVSLAFAIVWTITLPLWLVPGFALILPLALWGWLNYRVMSYDALARHATHDERRAIIARRHLSLWFLGVAIAALGVVPTLIWVGGTAAFIFAPLFAFLSLWLYVCVFVYSSLAFAHLCLDALARNRRV